MTKIKKENKLTNKLFAYHINIQKDWSKQFSNWLPVKFIKKCQQ